MIRDQRATSFTFHHTIHSARELEDRLASAGFGEVRAFGDLTGREYGPGAERLVTVARKV